MAESMLPRPRCGAAAILLASLLGCTACSRAKDSGPAATSSAASATSLSSRAPGNSATDASADDEADGGLPAMPSGSTPVVDLAGLTTLPPPVAEGRPRVGVIGWVVPIFTKPDKNASRIGTLRAGAVVEATDEQVGTAGCAKGWRKLVPAGYVCIDDDSVTLDLDHPVVRAANRRPEIAEKLPYMYGTCTRGGPVYSRVPSAEELKRYEPGLKTHLEKWRDDEENGASYGLEVWLRYTKRTVPPALEALDQRLTDDDIPWFVRDGATAPTPSGITRHADSPKIDQVERRQGRSFIYSFLNEGRRYNVTPDLTVIPADRFRPIRGSSFHGWLVGKEIHFPFALVRMQGARKWQWNGDKEQMVDAGPLEWRSAVDLTDKKRFYKNVLHYETKEGFWVDDRHAGRVDPAKKWPKWAKNGEKWIDINLTKQVLLAYEGTTAVFATIVSSGEAGLEDPETSTATERGIFRIHTKHVAATMDSDVVGEEFELRDVPYVQYFKEGYALHGAYWHDKFGQPKSHGCVNLAPEDARRLFFWTEPQVPLGWHSASKRLTGTVVFVHS
jgi:hypothetical protein